jgi:hypothetical protein
VAKGSFSWAVLAHGPGPVSATRAVLARTRLRVGDLDVIESNEAFAAQACAVMDGLSLDPAKVSPNDFGISLGHPAGATGALITEKALYELQRLRGRYALVTMCIGAGRRACLLRAGGRQRSDSNHVLARIQTRTRYEIVAETPRHALADRDGQGLPTHAQWRWPQNTSTSTGAGSAKPKRPPPGGFSRSACAAGA